MPVTDGNVHAAKLEIGVKFNVTISVDVCSAHNNELVGSVSCSTTECYQPTTDKYAQVWY